MLLEAASVHHGPHPLDFILLLYDELVKRLDGGKRHKAIQEQQAEMERMREVMKSINDKRSDK